MAQPMTTPSYKPPPPRPPTSEPLGRALPQVGNCGPLVEIGLFPMTLYANLPAVNRFPKANVSFHTMDLSTACTAVIFYAILLLIPVLVTFGTHAIPRTSMVLVAHTH